MLSAYIIQGVEKTQIQSNITLQSFKNKVYSNSPFLIAVRIGQHRETQGRWSKRKRGGTEQKEK